MKTLLAALCLAAAVNAAAATTELLSDDDLARVVAARSGERLHCANLVIQSIEAERRACGSEPGCASLRNDEYSAMSMVRLSAGGIQEGREEFTLGVMARSGCPGVFTFTRPGRGSVLVERTRWSSGSGEAGGEYFNAVPMGADGSMMPPPPEGSRSGSDLVNDLQARIEGLLGFNVTPHLRCGLSAYELRRFRVRNGVISYSDKEDAFLGCIWRSRNEP